MVARRALGTVRVQAPEDIGGRSKAPGKRPHILLQGRALRAVVGGLRPVAAAHHALSLPAALHGPVVALVANAGNPVRPHVRVTDDADTLVPVTEHCSSCAGSISEARMARVP